MTSQDFLGFHSMSPLPEGGLAAPVPQLENVFDDEGSKIHKAEMVLGPDPLLGLSDDDEEVMEFYPRP